MTTERTFIACKPDAVQRGLVSDIMGRFEKRGYKLVALKMKQASKEEAEAHYSDLMDRPFFPALLAFITSSPMVCMVWEGLDVVKQGRAMIGATNPLASAPGTIRGDYCIVTGKNIVHGSDSVESAEREISIWFTPDEVVSYKGTAEDWIYE